MRPTPWGRIFDKSPPTKKAHLTLAQEHFLKLSPANMGSSPSFYFECRHGYQYDVHQSSAGEEFVLERKWMKLSRVIKHWKKNTTLTYLDQPTIHTEETVQSISPTKCWDFHSSLKNMEHPSKPPIKTLWRTKFLWRSVFQNLPNSVGWSVGRILLLEVLQDHHGLAKRCEARSGGRQGHRVLWALWFETQGEGA